LFVEVFAVIRLGGRQVSIACAVAVAVLLAAAARPAAGQRQIYADVYLDKARGMWLGELIGNYAGKGYVPGTKTYREGYIVRGGAYYDVGWDNVLATTTWLGDDDTCFEYLYLDMLAQSAAPTSAEIRQGWLGNIPASSVYIANRQARYLMDPPPTGENLSPPATGSFRNNMYAAAIDSQITTESLGALVPGMRQRAADISGAFAGVSNEGFSAHAAQFYAAMYAAGAMESDVPTVIDEALAVVPLSSRTHEVIDAVRTFRSNQADPTDWRACQRMLHDNYGAGSSDGRYRGWIESTVNLGLTTMSLLYGEGDFQQTVEIGVLGGYDADCNPATAAGLLGMIKGYAGVDGNSGILAELPSTPSDAYDVRCLTTIGALTTVSQVAQHFADAAETQIAAAGGSVIGEGTEKHYLLPNDTVAAPPELPNPAGPGGLVGRMLAAGGQVSVSASVPRYDTAYDRHNLASIIDGVTDLRYNGYRPYWTYDGDNPQPAGGDWYQLDFPRDMTFNKVVYYEGDIRYAGGPNSNPREVLPYGGFFEDLTVEVLRGGQWHGVTGLTLSEALDANAFYQTIEMTFDPIAGTAVRIRGNAGGSQQFTTIVELEADGAMGVAGDCNEDGLVDYVDLMTVIENFDAFGQWSDGDFNFNGLIDAGDYIAMKRSLIAAANGDNLPEPTSLLLLLAGAALLPARRRSPSISREAGLEGPTQGHS